jgi:hypothetical protein
MQWTLTASVIQPFDLLSIVDFSPFGFGAIEYFVQLKSSFETIACDIRIMHYNLQIIMNNETADSLFILSLFSS